MSNQALTWAYGLYLGSAPQKAVLLYLADRAREDGTCLLYTSPSPRDTR